jgi:hypothetical protein
MPLPSFLRRLVSIAPGLLLCSLAWAETTPRVVTEDIGRFWAAYDHLRQESDPSKKKQWLQAEYLDRGSPGLKAFVERKRCSAEKYVDALSKYPRFWDSVRANTLAIDVPSVDAELKKFRSLYPEMRPASAYVVIGCMTSNGTTEGDKVLIGAEIAAGDPRVDLSELPDAFRKRLSTYFATQPARKLALLMVHEYVHTQQPDGSKAALLGQVLGEGGADFVAERITGKVPDLPYMRYGPAHDEAIKHQFAKDMDKTAYDDWLYNDADNAFGTSDLGYYVGYAICKAYYARAADKRTALRDIIRLNYADPAAARAFLDKSGYLAQ